MKYFYILFFLVFSTLNAAKIDANLEIVKKANTIPNVVVSIANDSKEIQTLSKLKFLLEQDLKISGHFDVIKDTYLTSFDAYPNFVILSNNKADLYINLSATKNQNGTYAVNMKLYDVNAQLNILQKTFTTSKIDRFPFLAHRIAITVNDYFKAPSIDWMDKFVIMSIYKDSKEADIVIADYSLTFRKTLVTGGLNIFPKWASDEQKEIYYTSYNYAKPTLVKLNIYTSKKETVMSSDGMITCSDVSSDGSKLLITAAPNSQPDIYVYDKRTKQKQRVTTYSGIDVSGQFIDDDQRVVFVSNRLGSPNIFAKKINSRAVEKLVYHSTNNSSVTTKGNNIVYASRDSANAFGGKNFNLYLMSTKSDSLTRLTVSGVNQFPNFSADGESLIFIKTQNDVSSVGILRLNFNSTYLFPLKGNKIQSIDW
jgi:TolB protein